MVCLTVGGEDKDEAKRGILEVLRLITFYQQPELWREVSDVIVKDGKLDLSGVISSDHIASLVYLLKSGEATAITALE